MGEEARGEIRSGITEGLNGYVPKAGRCLKAVGSLLSKLVYVGGQKTPVWYFTLVDYIHHIGVHQYHEFLP